MNVAGKNAFRTRCTVSRSDCSAGESFSRIVQPTSSHPENMDSDRRTGPSDIVRHPDFRTTDLAPLCLSTELQDDLVNLLDAGRTNRMATRLESPARIYRDIPVQCSYTFTRHCSCLAFFAEPEVF